MSPYCLALTTVPSEELAQNILRHLLEKRLIACGQIGGPIQSIYRWKGRIEEGREFSLSLKAKSLKLKEIIAEISNLHPFEVPEILSISIEDGSPLYLNWLKQELE